MTLLCLSYTLSYEISVRYINNGLYKIETLNTLWDFTFMISKNNYNCEITNNDVIVLTYLWENKYIYTEQLKFQLYFLINYSDYYSFYFDLERTIFVYVL